MFYMFTSTVRCCIVVIVGKETFTRRATMETIYEVENRHQPRLRLSHNKESALPYVIHHVNPSNGDLYWGRYYRNLYDASVALKDIYGIRYLKGLNS